MLLWSWFWFICLIYSFDSCDITSLKHPTILACDCPLQVWCILSKTAFLEFWILTQHLPSDFFSLSHWIWTFICTILHTKMNKIYIVDKLGYLFALTTGKWTMIPSKCCNYAQCMFVIRPESHLWNRENSGFRLDISWHILFIFILQVFHLPLLCYHL